jgi:hypothetical protein
VKIGAGMTIIMIKKAVIPSKDYGFVFNFPLPFAGITQTGS